MPPGGFGTTMLIAFDGYSCGWPPNGTINNAIAAINLFVMASLLLTVRPRRDRDWPALQDVSRCPVRWQAKRSPVARQDRTLRVEFKPAIRPRRRALEP